MYSLFSVSFEVFVAMENRKASIDAIYVLKVNIQCCNDCHRKITKRLLRVSGVYSVGIDMAEGLVKIGGKDNLDPSILIKTVAIAGKRAQLQSIEKTTAAVDSGQPSNPSAGNAADVLCNNTGPAQNGNSGSGHFSDHGGRSGQIHINEAAAVKPPPCNWPFMRPPLQFGGVGFRPLPPPMVPMPPPVPPPHRYHWRPEPPPLMCRRTTDTINRSHHQRYRPAYGYYRWAEPPPEMPPCWQQHPPPIRNAPEHYLFSDENIEGCAIV